MRVGFLKRCEGKRVVGEQEQVWHAISIAIAIFGAVGFNDMRVGGCWGFCNQPFHTKQAFTRCLMQFLLK